MATFLDITLLGGAKVVFTFLLVYVIVWGLLTWIKPFGKNVPTGPYAIIGLVAAFFSVVSGTVRYLVEFITPWFLFLIIVLFFVLFIIRMFGLGEGDLKAIIGNSTVHILLLSVIGIILLFGLGSAFGQKSLEATQGQVGGMYYHGDAYLTSTDAEIGGTTPGTNIGSDGVTTLQPGQDLNPVAGGTGSLYGGAAQPGQPGATNTGSFSLNLVNTLLHPKVMAIIAIFLIGTITVWLMARPSWV